jgi:hypothetical protein
MLSWSSGSTSWKFFTEAIVTRPLKLSTYAPTCRTRQQEIPNSHGMFRRGLDTPSTTLSALTEDHDIRQRRRRPLLIPSNDINR